MKERTIGFIMGLIAGCALTIGAFALIENSQGDTKSTNSEKSASKDNQNQNDHRITFFEKPISYENKDSTSFKVYQVLESNALAREISDERYDLYYGKTVLLIDGQYYCDQIVEIDHPKQLGLFKENVYSTYPIVH